MRWWVIGGALAAALFLLPLIGIPLPISPLLAITFIMVCANLVTLRRLNSEDSDNPLTIFGQLIFDLLAMGALLYFSGGATNPLVFMLLPPVAVAAITLPTRWVVVVATLAVILYSLLMVRFEPLPIAYPLRAVALHLLGMWVTFAVSVFAIAWLVLRMSDTLRQREIALAQAREQALRNERMLALGTLAAGAAHELGTPLATMAILADDLAQAPNLGGEARADLDLMRHQIAFCKRIITNISERAGAVRSEHIARIAADRWLQQLFEDWAKLRGHPDAVLECQGGAVPDVVADPSLEYALRNVLDNALRAGSPVQISASWDRATLRIAVRDSGPGFSAADLQRAGNEIFPAHAQGSGLGLLLARAAVERQGGQLLLSNLERSGALVEIEIPVAHGES